MSTAVQSWTAACMTPDEWDEWQRFNPVNAHADRPCADCPLGYAAEMRAIGRCNGQPGAVEEDEEMIDTGTAPLNGNTLAIHRRTALDVQPPPCGSCAHEPVCSLRVALEDMAEIETSARPLPAGLRLALVATVECAHFLRDRAKPAPVRVLTSQERGAAIAGAGRAKRETTPEARENMRRAAIAAIQRRRDREAAASA